MTGTVGIIATHMEFALLIDQVAIHRGVTQGTSMLGSQQAGFRLVVCILVNCFITRGKIDCCFTALLWRQGIAGTAQEYPGAGCANLHGAIACATGNIRHCRLIALHAIGLGFFCLLQQAPEFSIEVVQQGFPAQFPLRHFVEVFLH